MDLKKSKAGHYEVLGETHAKYEFFQVGWNPYSRFLDVDKVDMVLRRLDGGVPAYREVQVRSGKLYPVKGGWQQRLFDITSWRFFRKDEFDHAGSHLFLAYVLSADDAYRGDLFLFPIREFEKAIRCAPIAGGKHRVYISRCKEDAQRWVLRRKGKFEKISDTTCPDVSRYRRNFSLLEIGHRPDPAR